MALQSLEKEGLPFEITTLSSINDINEFLIFLEETEKSISAENLSVIYSFIKLDPDGADAYYNRGVVKANAGLSYCSDFKKACELGIKEVCEVYNDQCR